MRQSTLHFNRELFVGECGALIVANVVAPVAARFTDNAAVISSVAVAGTLIGGSLSWLAARIYDQMKQKTLSAKKMVGDIGYFTPAAIILGFCVYDPAIYFISHHLLLRGDAVGVAVIFGQIAAFLLFLLALNGYRLLLLRFRGKTL